MRLRRQPPRLLRYLVRSIHRRQCPPIRPRACQRIRRRRNRLRHPPQLTLPSRRQPLLHRQLALQLQCRPRLRRAHRNQRILLHRRRHQLIPQHQPRLLRPRQPILHHRYRPAHQHRHPHLPLLRRRLTHRLLYRPRHQPTRHLQRQPIRPLRHPRRHLRRRNSPPCTCRECSRG